MRLTYNVDGRGRMENDILTNILRKRGIKDIYHFLNPNQDDLLDPTELLNIDQAADRVWDGLDNDQKFHVHLDSDLDGICAGSIMYRWLDHHIEDKSKLSWSINQGKSHGMNREVVKEVKKANPDVLIIVDSLDSGNGYYKELKEKMNVDIIVLDHHMVNPEIDYDSYITLVSSQVDYSNKDLCGAGVVYKFSEYLNRFDPDPFDEGLAELAAAGTVGDMMNLDEDHMENRMIVHQALVDNQPVNPIIKEIVGQYDINSKTFSFSVAPLVNAANRLGENKLAAEAFLFQDECVKSVKKLKAIKDKQNEIVAEQVEKITEQLKRLKSRNFLIAMIDESSGGISGLIGNKLLDKYKMPVLVLRDTPTGYSGSGRAKHVESFIDICKSTGLAKCAGHENAFGVQCINHDEFEEFCDKLDVALDEVDYKDDDGDADCLITPEEMTFLMIDSVKKIDRISGHGFDAIKFAVELDEYEVTTMSNGKHLIFTLLDDDVVFVKWNAGFLLEEYEDHALCGDKVTLIGTLEDGRMGKYNRRMIIDRIMVEEEEEDYE